MKTFYLIDFENEVENVLKNIRFAEEPIDWDLVKEVQEIICKRIMIFLKYFLIQMTEN